MDRQPVRERTIEAKLEGIEVTTEISVPEAHDDPERVLDLVDDEIRDAMVCIALRL